MACYSLWQFIRFYGYFFAALLKLIYIQINGLCRTFETMIFFSFCIKKLCTVKKQKSWKKRDLFFFEKSQYCLTSVFDIPINLVLAVSLLTIYPLGSKHQYNSFHTFGVSSPTESLKLLRISVIASMNFVTFIIVCKNYRTSDQ